MVLVNLYSFEGLVVALKANYLLVELLSGQNFNYPLNIRDKASSFRFLCTRRNRLDYYSDFVNVGDRVLIEELDWNQFRAVIKEVLPRTSYLKRPSIANVTKIFVVLSLQDPSFDYDQATRFLLVAEQTSLPITLILTKSDLVSINVLDSQIDRLKNWGYESLPVSIINKQGLSALYSILQSTQISILCGPSGVGKTSLINLILPDMSLKVGHLSSKLRRGMHTTRHVELFSLGRGALVADSPGFNRPELKFDHTSDLANLFPEIRNQLKNYPCKFRNCLHLDEPGCGIDRSWERYIYYRKYLEEIPRSNY